MRGAKILSSFAAVVVAAIIISWFAYSSYSAAVDRRIRSTLAENGVVVIEYSVRDGGDGLLLNILADGEDSVCENVMQMRHVVNAIRNSSLDYDTYYIRLNSADGSVRYSKSYRNIKQKTEMQIAASDADIQHFEYELKYLLAEIESGTPAVRFYESVGCEGKAVFIQVRADKDSANDVLTACYNAVLSFNEQGGGVQRVSIDILDDDAESIFVLSDDLLYGDRIFMKGSAYTAVETDFD